MVVTPSPQVHIPGKSFDLSPLQSQFRGAISEGAEDGNSKVSKIAFVARRHGESLNACSAGDHGVLGQGIGPRVDQAGIFAKASYIHGQHLGTLFQPCRPYFDLVCFRRVRPAGQLYAPLYLTESDRRKEPLFQPEALDPGNRPAMRFGFAQLGNDVRVDQVGGQSSTGGLRDFKRPRFGSGSSHPGPSPRSTSFHVNRFWSLSLHHSSAETTTAVSIPRRVTICGPFERVSSISSLNRAFASCSCHLVIGIRKQIISYD
jgi:hypothetical protein